MTEPGKAQQPQAHPLRCETCEYGKKHLRILYPNGEPKTRLTKCDKLDRALSHEEVDIISCIGCASHTSASQQRIEQAIVQLEGALSYKNRVSCDHSIKNAIALLQAGRK